MSYSKIEMSVVQWGEARGIVQHSTPNAQAIKTLEEVTELFVAIARNDRKLRWNPIDAIMLPAYSRKGTLLPNGLFVKDV